MRRGMRFFFHDRDGKGEGGGAELIGKNEMDNDMIL